MPGALTMPSCAKAQICRSSAGAYSSRSGRIASMPAQPDDGIDLDVGAHRGRARAHREVEHAAGAAADVVHGERLLGLGA